MKSKKTVKCFAHYIQYNANQGVEKELLFRTDCFLHFIKMSNSVTTQTSSKTEFNLPTVSRVPRQEPKYRSTARSNFIQKYSTLVYPENVHVESDHKKQGEKPVSTVKESINSKSRYWL